MIVRNGYDHQTKLQVPALVILVCTEQEHEKRAERCVKSYYCCTISRNRTRNRFINYGVWIRKMQQKLCQLCSQVRRSRFCGVDVFFIIFFCFFLRVSRISPRLRYICLCVLSGVLVRLFGLFPFACERLLWKVRQLFLKTVPQFLGIGFWDLPALACNHSRRYRAVALSRWHEIFLHLE